MKMDFSYLNAISEGDKEFIQEFVSTFETNNEAILKEMQVLMDNGNKSQLDKQAHQLKPTIEMLGMEECLTKVTKINDQPETTTQEDLDFIVKSSNEALSALKREYELD